MAKKKITSIALLVLLLFSIMPVLAQNGDSKCGVDICKDSFNEDGSVNKSNIQDNTDSMNRELIRNQFNLNAQSQERLQNMTGFKFQFDEDGKEDIVSVKEQVKFMGMFNMHLRTEYKIDNGELVLQKNMFEFLFKRGKF